MSKVVRPARERAGSPNEGRLRGLAEPAYAGFLCRTCPFTGQGNAPKLGSSDFAHARQGCYSECAVPRTPLPAKVRRACSVVTRLPGPGGATLIDDSADAALPAALAALETRAAPPAPP